MDIAKIRKKIKEESEIHKGGKAGKSEDGVQPMTHGKSENKAADDITAGAQQPSAGSVKTGDSKQQAEDSHLRQPASAGSQGSVAKSQTPVPVRVVSEQETVKEKSSSEPAGKTANPEDAVSGIIKILTFQLAAEEFAFRISEVGEILTPQQISMVPKAPDYILGITSVRGKVMPVLD